MSCQQRGSKIQIKGESLKSETVLAIGKFSILWSEFEKKNLNNNCTPKKLIEEGEKHKTSDAWREFAKKIQGRADYYEGLDIEFYVEYSLWPESAHRMQDEHMKLITEFIKSDGEESTSGGFLAIYRIRNNLLHGLKELEQLDNQIELFNAMNNILETL